MLRLRGLTVLSFTMLAFSVAALQPGPAEAADGYYNRLKLPYAAGQARVGVRVTEHGPGRHAVDFGMSYEDVFAMYSGQVAWTGAGHAQYGNYVVVDHLDNFCSIYAHLDRLYVRGGQPVLQGERLGRSGNTGNSTGPHLHAAVFRKLNGVCGPANAWTEVQMIFDEGPRRELRAGDWIMSRNVRQVAPYYLSIEGTSEHSVSVRWNDFSNNAQGFKVERRVGAGPWTPLAALGANSMRYMDEGLSLAASYCYRMRSFNTQGDSNYSNITCAVTGPSTGNSVAQTDVWSAGTPASPTYSAASLGGPQPPPTSAAPALDAGTFPADDDPKLAMNRYLGPDTADVRADSANPLLIIWDSVFVWLRLGE
jgi:murein DD-endopeptidase MepM/ murein hydrolase activator NlpD